MKIGFQQKQKQLGPATDSMFPKVDDMLKSTDYQKALKYVAHRKKIQNYRSLVDFLFCEVDAYQYVCFNSSWKRLCRDFYENKGPRLRFLINEQERSQYEKKLIVALAVAHKMFVVKKRRRWGSYVDEVEFRFQKAA